MKVTLEIYDEVNVKFVGLDLITRRKISDKLKFFLPQAKYMPAYTLGRWDGCVRFCELSGRTYLNLIGRILPIIIDADYDIEVDDQRKAWKFDFGEVTENLFEGKVWPKGHRYEGEPVVLRDYQVEIINNFLNTHQCIQQVATGAGKTLVTASLSYMCEPFGRTIVIVPNKDLVVQTEADYINLGLDVGVYFGDRKEYNKTHTICTWQSLEVLRKASKQYEAAMRELDDIAKEEIKLSGECWCCDQPLDSHKKNCIVGNGDINQFIKDVVCIMVDECFAAGTLVLTPSGYVAIETLTEGNIVLNYLEKDKVFKEDTVVKLHKNLLHSHSEKMYKLEFDNGKVISVTGNHKFLTHNRGWVRADEITEDDNIVEFDK